MPNHPWCGCLGGLAKSLCSGGKEGGRRTLEDECGGGREAADAMAKEARKAGLVLRSSGTMTADESNCFVSVYSKRGEKGVNQDCSIVWKAYGGQDDMMFLGIFDGHGPWGHFVAKHVRDSLPSSLLCSWQESLAMGSHSPEFGLASAKKKKPTPGDVWTQSFLRSCAAVDEELRKNDDFDSVHGGTTALTVVKQGDLLITANIGDSRAVLVTTDDDGNLTPVQLTYEFKPDLPQEAERILQCQGRVFCMEDEPGVHRLWLPDEQTPGLAMSRAFGDHCMKNFGLISVPEVTQRYVASKDQFLVIATDGVWDVISNQEAVMIVSSTPDKRKSAKRLVKCAARAWRHKRQNVLLDDCSAICVFFESSINQHMSEHS